MTSALEVVFTPVEVRTRKGRTLEVREYDTDDFGALVEMYKRFAPKRVAQGLPPPGTRRIARWLDRLQCQSRALVAVADRRVVGHALLCPISDAEVEFAVFVHQDFRREGLGTALAFRAVCLAERMGFARLVLTTQISNLVAIHVYRKVGFEIVSTYDDEVEMKLELVLERGALSRAA